MSYVPFEVDQTVDGLQFISLSFAEDGMFDHFMS